MTKNSGPESETGQTLGEPLQIATPFAGHERHAADPDQRVVLRTSQLRDAQVEKDDAERGHTRGLLETEQGSRIIIDNIPGLVALLSPLGEVEVLNHRMLEYFGKTLAEMKRWDESDIIHPADRPHVIEVFAQAIGSGTPLEYEARLKRFDGVHRWFQVRG